MRKILVHVFKRQDQTLIHIVTMYITLVIATVFAIIQAVA
jgi:hypothetical protein